MRVAALITVAALLGSNGCASKGANHIGNPLTLPGRAIINAVQNKSYEARRAKLSEYVQANRNALYADIDQGGGQSLSSAMEIASVSQERRAALIAELRANPQIYRQSDIEPLIVAIMVHGP